ncbi:putative membrane protein C20F10.07 [Choanephora cucurbitarum]|uniref:Putative membrane protein C20F10.07 n=1 Tax=Choanephora cucurbitarum TaxID=101091 RepID=A0A1C7NG13_9FUNG|nr:putative membrane protein C20F10.07 [Choanephora cucurbitarum]
MDDNSLKADADTKKARHHSNTISGGRPPALDISLARPTHIRRSSEGSPGVPPPICVSEPTPIEPSTDTTDVFFHKSRPTTPNYSTDEDNASVSSKNGSASLLKKNSKLNLSESPSGQNKKKSRSRASSLTSSLLNEIKESSTIQSLASKIKPRVNQDELDTDRVSIDGKESVTANSTITNSTVLLANAKRNQDFHALFRSVPEDDSLIEDFGCALQKEILLQGRIYVSESHLCFNANIFGWVTNLVIAFADVIEIEKKTTAYFIPNAIQISTQASKHFFASFLSRDQAYDLMVETWHTVRPEFAPKDESVQNAEENGSYSTDDENNSSSDYDSDTENSYTDESDSEDELKSAKDSQGLQDGRKGDPRSRKISMAGSLPAFKDAKLADSTARRRAQSELPKPNFQMMNEKPSKSSMDEGAEKPKQSTESRPQINEKTECECGQSGTHYPNVVMDQVYSGNIEKMYDLLFVNNFMKDFLVDNQKSLELEMGEWKKGEGNVLKVRELSYIKQLGGAIGPKQTKCYLTQELLHYDLDSYVSVLSTTLTPDVPSGSSFSCKTRTCLTYAGKGKVRVTVTVQVEFTKSSWLKSTIEKASIDGQQTYYKELDAALRKHVKEHGSSERSDNGKKRRKHKKPRHRRSSKEAAEQSKVEAPKSTSEKILETASNLFSDILKPLIEAITSPNSTHLTLFCLIMMVCINIFIARKMAVVERQLIELTRATPLDSLPKDSIHYQASKAKQERRYLPEEEDLWAWLGSIDPQRSEEQREQVQIPIKKDLKEQEAIWDEAIKYSKAAKERLDKHMVELGEMIQKAESNLQSVTSSVDQQRQKMKQATQ